MDGADNRCATYLKNTLKFGLLPYIHVNAAILLLPGEIMTAISLSAMHNKTCPAWLTSLPVAVKIINLNLLG